MLEYVGMPSFKFICVAQVSGNFQKLPDGHARPARRHKL